MTTDCVGGVWTYALDLASHLEADGDEILLAVMGGTPTDDQREQLEVSRVSAFRIRPYALEWMAEPDADLAAAGAWLLDLAAEHRPDVVHLNQFAHAPLPWPSPILVVAHSDVVTWWRAVHGCDPGPAWDRYRQRVAAGLAAADAVVAPTAAMLDQLQAAYEVPVHCAVVPNGRSLAVPQRCRRRQMVAVGRVWDEAKNIGAAVRAAQDLPWPLVVAGEGVVDDAGARVVGRRSSAEVADLLAASAIFVEPARYEPFGLAALEAGLAGCALVLGDIASLREVWGEAATYVDPGDEGALREALRALIDDPDLLRARQHAAAGRAATFDAATMAAAYADLYRGLCGTPAPRDRIAS